MGTQLRLAIALTVIGSMATQADSADSPLAAGKQHQFDVVIAGGSTAAFAAAIAAAESGAQTALIEPTDWVGGQLTSSGVPAVDEAWHKLRSPDGEELLDVAKIARDPRNITPSFLAALNSIQPRGQCWVSRFCFCPDRFVVDQLRPLEQRVSDRLTVFLDTVVKQVELSEDGSQIKSLTAITRRPKPGVAANGYDRLPSQDIVDWYAPGNSPRFEKVVLRFVGPADGSRPAVFIDATEWGELLALADAPYLQGVDAGDGATTGNDACGQATVFCFAQELHAEPIASQPPLEKAAADAKAPGLGFGMYHDRADAWPQIWKYRRIRGRGAPAPGDICLQNWGYSIKLREGGNDYPFGYLFVNKRDTAAQRSDWRGGVDLTVMADAEQRALAWHWWFKHHGPEQFDPRQILLNSAVLGTAHGLAKLPYIRDTRRSIGLDGFLLKLSDMTGPASEVTGTRFPDRIALGAYAADVHGLETCPAPAVPQDSPETLPFYIPFRALTNARLQNFLVAGKTMAQSFLANSGTRLHPIEWSSGTAAGVAAAYMARSGSTSRQAYESIDDWRAEAARLTPADWSALPSEN
jgi:hypothetical protein